LTTNQSKTGGTKSPGNKGQSVFDPREKGRISQFDEGAKDSCSRNNLLVSPETNSRDRIKKEISPTRTVNIEIVQPADSLDSFKFSFSKIPASSDSQTQFTIPNFNIPNENMQILMNREPQFNQLKENKQNIIKNEKPLSKLISEKNNWNIAKLKNICKDRKLFQSDKIVNEQNQSFRDKSHGYFNRKITFSIPSSTNPFKGPTEATRTMDRIFPNRNTHYVDSTSIPFIDKSKDKQKRNISANSRSSKESHEAKIYANRLSEEKNYKSYLDLHQNSYSNLLPSSSIFRHINM
jgi:hypothetical protein